MVTRAVSRALRDLALERGRLLVACSAGIDSTVLLDALQELGWNLSIGHVNHGLRGEASEADEAFVLDLGAARGIAVGVERVDPTALRQGGSSRERPTLQEAARRLRYQALERLARSSQADWIATAHTTDDQAETVLMRLLRGSGPDGLTGIPPRSGRVVRPLLGVRRRQVEEWAAQRGLTWREDASNASPAYTRNRVRALIRQLEEEFNPNLSRSLGDLAEAHRGDRAWLDALVEREAESRISNFGDVWVIEGKDWEAMPDALARRLAREALRRAGIGREVTRVHLDRMVDFLRRGRAQAAMELPSGWELVREGGAFLVRAKLTKTKR